MARTREEILKDMDNWRETNKYVYESLKEELKSLELKPVIPIQKNELDLNGDGVVDKLDSSLAGKVLKKSKKK